MNKNNQLLLPALRGIIGDWVYYTCLVPISEIASRVEYAQDIHQSKELSEMIQRSLEGKRAEDISLYLEKTEERFFNSLVLATYDGYPEWLEIDSIEAVNNAQLNDLVIENMEDTLGFLSLSGNEKIFAVDGQHRLSGIKKAINNKVSFGNERLPVILISHQEKKRERTRRLFTILNKTARPVKKSDIIALDEDDTMAIISRRLVENNSWFSSPKILVSSSENIPVTNKISLTTITNLYDILKIIFKYKDGSKSDEKLKFYRPSDLELDNYYDYALKFFKKLSDSFPEVQELFLSAEPALVTQKYRGEHGGHLLFRPIGLIIFTKVAILYSKNYDCSLFESVSKLSIIPTKLNSRPYRNIIWDPIRNKIISSGRTLAIELLSYMLDISSNTDKLKINYAKAHGESIAKELPKKIIK